MSPPRRVAPRPLSGGHDLMNLMGRTGSRGISHTAASQPAAGQPESTLLVWQEVPRLQWTRPARHTCSFKMTGGTSGAAALFLLVTIRCLEVRASSESSWVGFHRSHTKPAACELQCWVMGFEVSWRFPAGENLVALTCSMLPADCWGARRSSGGQWWASISPWLTAATLLLHRKMCTLVMSHTCQVK